MEKNVISGDLAVGVDIGGTNIRAGLVNRNGEVVGRSFALPTKGNDTADSIIGRIREAINFVLTDREIRHHNILGIGMGVTGPLNVPDGLILECPQLPSLHYFPLRAKINEIFQMPVFMNNDADAMILGESLWGSGKGYGLVLGFTLGTGLGCGIVSDGKIMPGRRDLSGEIWSSPYKDVTIEDFVSGRGISDLYRKISGQTKSALEIGALGNNGDEEALQVWYEFGKAFGFALSWTINILDPDIVVVGGSISDSFHLFGKSAHDYAARFSCPSPLALPPLVKATLGNDAGFIGGAALVYESLV